LKIFFKHFFPADYELPKSYLPPNVCKDGDFYQLEIEGIRRPLYLYRRCNNVQSVVRLEMIYITAGESYFLRLITKNRAYKSFEDARTVDGITYITFQEAAVAANYIEDANDALVCFTEACGYADGMADVHLRPSSLRGLFAHLTLNGYPTLKIFNEDCFLQAMIRDWTDFSKAPRLSQPEVRHSKNCFTMHSNLSDF
jgi:hypothetical protein